MAPSAAFSFANAGQPLSPLIPDSDSDDSEEEVKAPPASFSFANSQLRTPVDSDDSDDSEQDYYPPPLPTNDDVARMKITQLRKVIDDHSLRQRNGNRITTSGLGRMMQMVVADVQEALGRKRIYHQSLEQKLEQKRRAREVRRQNEAKAATAPNPAPIPWSSMDFGDCDDSLCGICGRPEPGVWDGDELQEDIICNQCAAARWNYDEGTDCYVCLGPTHGTHHARTMHAPCTHHARTAHATCTHCTHAQAPCLPPHLLSLPPHLLSLPPHLLSLRLVPHSTLSHAFTQHARHTQATRLTQRLTQLTKRRVKCWHVKVNGTNIEHLVHLLMSYYDSRVIPVIFHTNFLIFLY